MRFLRGTRRFESMMEERGLIGLEARTVDGEVGRISEIVTDEGTGEVTHVIVDIGEDQRMEIPITDLSLDPEADFATFHADPSDEEPGDHVGDEEMPQSHAPARDIGPEDQTHEGQFVTTPTDEHEAASLSEETSTESGEAGNWEDEASTTLDSGYPRNDAYIDPDTGQERERYPEGEDLRGDVEQLLDDTELRLREVREGVIVLEGTMVSQEDLEEILSDIDDIDGVLDVDTTDVNVGT
jgi:sporulation protein YlmC with PRC-barrel domain